MGTLNRPSFTLESSPEGRLCENDYRLASQAITSDPGGNNGTVGYSYDAVGNRTQMTSTLNAVPPGSFFYDANDQLTTDTYDANGNTISSGGISYSYDFENRMLTRGAVTIVYDGDGNRVSETAAGVTTKYLVDTLNPTGYSQVVDELVSGSVTRTYAYGLQRVSENQKISGTWTPSFYGYDGHGNVRFLTNTSGTVGNTYQFDAFGNQIASTGTTPNNYLFSGEQYDGSTNLLYLRARYYRMPTGRFLTMDPFEQRQHSCCQEISSTPYIVRAGLNTCCGSCAPAPSNTYVYALNDPVNKVDPRGLQALVEFAKITEEDVEAALARKAAYRACLRECWGYCEEIYTKLPPLEIESEMALVLCHAACELTCRAIFPN